jgi:hypothetical protein
MSTFTNYDNYECPEQPVKYTKTNDGLCVSDQLQTVCDIPNYIQNTDKKCVGPGNPYCNAAGKKFRSLVCINSDTNNAVPSENCAGLTKPIVQDDCIGNSPPITFSWVSNAWEKCNDGSKSRTVVCKDNKGNSVDGKLCTGFKGFGTGEKPAETEVCAKTYSWVVGPWKATAPVPVPEGYAAEEKKGFFSTKLWKAILCIIIFFLIGGLIVKLEDNSSDLL